MASHNHPTGQVGRAASLGVDALAIANVLAKRGHQTEVRGQSVGVLVGKTAANHDEVGAVG